jgi:hypothetical protein
MLGSGKGKDWAKELGWEERELWNFWNLDDLSDIKVNVGGMVEKKT